MALTNFTGDENQKTIKELHCSAEVTMMGEVYNHLIYVLVLNICLSITAFLGNSLILVALHKESSLHPPSKLLYRSLATTDLCVGIIEGPLVVTRLIAVMNKEWIICRYAFESNFFTSYALFSASLLTLTAISIERLLVLKLGLRYKQVVTLKRTYLAVIVLWAVSIAGTTMHFWDPLLALWYGNIGTALCLVTSVFSYTEILLTLRRNQIQVQNNVSQGQPSRTIPFNIARYRKAVYTALWVQVTLVVCFLPFVIASALSSQGGPSLSVFLARNYSAALLYLNSSLNPLLYYWKIRAVRKAVKNTIRQLSCLC